MPFYVALPSPTIDWSIEDGRDESRSRSATRARSPRSPAGFPTAAVARVRLTPEGSPAANPAFDVTPARLVTGLITERGVCAASREGLLSLFPERRAA